MKGFNINRFALGFVNIRVLEYSLFILFLLTLPSQAGWVWMHGHSGHIEDETLLLKPEPVLESIWVEVEQEQPPIDSHDKVGSWWAPGWFITALDLDADSPLGSAGPVVGAALFERQLPAPLITRRFEGLDFTLISPKGSEGTKNWVHFSIPTPQGKLVSKIGLRFITDSELATVKEVIVFDAEKRIEKFEGNWFGDNATQPLELEFKDANGEPLPKQFNYGLGISIGLVSQWIPNPEADFYHYKFHSAGADFVDD